MHIMIVAIYQELTVSGIDLFKHLCFKLSIACQSISKSIYSMHAPWLLGVPTEVIWQVLGVKIESKG